jgi:hypothetical protein
MKAAHLMSMGRFRETDSIARIVLELDHRHGPSTSTSAKAQRLITGSSSWLRRDPREYLRRARALIALTDSLGLQLTEERTFALSAELEALIVLGRIDEAARRVQADSGRREAAFGPQPLLASHVASNEATIAGVLGDTARRRVKIARAMQLLHQAEKVPPSDMLVIADAFIDDALARGANDDAVRVALASREMMLQAGSPLYIAFSQMYAGRALLSAHDAMAAEQAFRAGIEVLDNSPDLRSMIPRLRRPLVQALTAQGRTAEADSIRKLDPPIAAVARCTPGGDWRGCPDS